MSKYDNSEARVPNQALLARIAALESALRKFGSGWHVEFQTGKYFCHACGNEKAAGHADSCPFEHAARLLKS